MNQRGFALVESLGTLAFAAIALTAGTMIAYVSFAHLWLKHAAYETSICLSTPATAARCKSDLMRATARALPLGRLENSALKRSKNKVETKLLWSVAGGISLSIEDVRPLPLLGPERRR
jgi:hypothetical protein